MTLVRPQAVTTTVDDAREVSGPDEMGSFDDGRAHCCLGQFGGVWAL